VENYHYVRAAAVRQGPLLGRALTPEIFNLARGFVYEEATHEHYFLRTLAEWGIPKNDVEESVPLTGTSQFIALQHRMAHLSILDYLAGSACLEVDPKIYAVAGDPYALWEDVYKIVPKILAPIREHIREDVASGHSQLFRTAAIATDDSSLAIGYSEECLLFGPNRFRGHQNLAARDVRALFFKTAKVFVRTDCSLKLCLEHAGLFIASKGAIF
jgi:hypothetical protein